MSILRKIQQLSPWASAVNVGAAAYRVIGWVGVVGGPLVGAVMSVWAYLDEMPRILVVAYFMLGFIFTVELVRLVQIAWDGWRLRRLRKTRIEPLTDSQIFDALIQKEELARRIEEIRNNPSLSLIDKERDIVQHRQEIAVIDEKIDASAYEISVFLALNYITTRRWEISFEDISNQEKIVGKLRRATNELRQQACNGSIVIHGRNEGCSPSVIEPIEAEFWKRNRLEAGLNSDGEFSIRTTSSRKGATNGGDESYEEMFVSKKQIAKLWPSRKYTRWGL